MHYFNTKTPLLSPLPPTYTNIMTIALRNGSEIRR
jgi:hypothetical protein